MPTRLKNADRKALREGPAPFSHHAGKFRDLHEEKGRAEHECERGENQEATDCRRSAANAPSPQV